MKRLVDWHLMQWKVAPSRKPLILRGARQVGKTYAVRQFGQGFKSFVEINFEQVKEARRVFEKNLDPVRILMEFKSLLRCEITPGETLLFLDEIQECPEAITALRYFYEQMPLLHVIAAGSLLDFAIEKVGIPVGRVSSLYLFPLSFMEFLVAMGYNLAVEAILNQEKGVPLSETIHGMLLELLGRYLAIGGLPEVVAQWIRTADPLQSEKILHSIADTYRQDFQKYAKKHQLKYLDILFDQIPYLLGDQFKYSNIHGDYQKRELAPCLDLLCHANVVHKIEHSAGNGLPLGAEINKEWFKVIFVDVALCQAILGLDLGSWFLDAKTAFVNQGAAVEAFVGQELLCYSPPDRKPNLYFWKRDKRGAQAEVDYLCHHKSIVIPVEVKCSEGKRLQSMHLFLEEHPQSPFGIRFSSLNYSLIGKIDSRPLYAVCSIGHEMQKEALAFLVAPSPGLPKTGS